MFGSTLTSVAEGLLAPLVMLSLEPEIDAEFQRSLAQLPDEEEGIAPYALGVVDVPRAHFLIANHFYLEGHGLGGIGPRDVGLLCSTVSRQYISFGGQTKGNYHLYISPSIWCNPLSSKGLRHERPLPTTVQG